LSGRFLFGTIQIGNRNWRFANLKDADHPKLNLLDQAVRKNFADLLLDRKGRKKCLCRESLDIRDCNGTDTID